MVEEKNMIFEKQNEVEMQQLIVAQHFTYSNAKRWSMVLLVVLVILPLGINIALFFPLPDIAIGLLALTSLVLLFAGEFIRGSIDNQKKAAAMLQQKFDLYVFGMGLKCEIDENFIAEQIEKYSKKDWERKKNWYQDYGDLDKNKAIFYCQKENVDWTGNISKKYCQFLLLIISALLITFVVNLIIQNSSVIKLLSILMAALPLLSYGISSYKKIRRDNNDLAEINRIANETNLNLSSLSDIELGNRISVLQTMIYKYRQTKYLIPDWFEQKFYKHLQSIEKRKADQRISENEKTKKQ